MKYDIRLLTKAADDLLGTVTNPVHRKILINYRRHAIFEVCGDYEAICAPDSMVEDPRYLMYMGGAPVQFHGMERVKALYRSMVDINATVMMFEDEVLRVDDHGFSSRATFQIFMPGKVALHFGAPVDYGDMDAIFIQTTDRIMVWDYADDGRLIGENIWVGGGAFRKCPEEEIITREECEDLLLPLLDKVPQSA